MKGVIRGLQVVLVLVLAAVLLAGGGLLAAGLTEPGAAPELFGQRLFLQQEDVMGPEIQPGDLVLAKPREAYAPGEAVLARDGAQVRALRIVGTVEGRLILRGDREDSEAEALFEETQVLGRIEAVLAGAGAALRTLASVPVLAGVGVLLVLVLLLPRLTRVRAAAGTRYRR